MHARSPSKANGCARRSAYTRSPEARSTSRSSECSRAAWSGSTSRSRSYAGSSALSPGRSERPSETRLDDSAADRVHRRLDAVLDLELHEDVRDVVLDRLRADEELPGDLGVVLAVGDQLQHLDLAVRELGADRLGRVGMRPLGTKPLQDLRRDLGRDQ